jgi:Rod binding domain-containing protein
VTVDPLGSLPVVPDAALPAEVRNGSGKDKQTYQAALGFEQQLLTQLTQAMVDTSNTSGDSSSDDSGDGSTDTSSDPTLDVYNQMLPDQLSSALVAGGGTGLADELYRAMRMEQP